MKPVGPGTPGKRDWAAKTSPGRQEVVGSKILQELRLPALSTSSTVSLDCIYKIQIQR